MGGPSPSLSRAVVSVVCLGASRVSRTDRSAGGPDQDLPGRQDVSIYEQLSDAHIEAVLIERAAAQRCELLVEEGADRWIAAFVKQRRFGRNRMTLLAHADDRRGALVLLLRHSDMAVHLGEVRRQHSSRH